MDNNFYKEAAELQEKYKKLIDEKRLTKKLCVIYAYLFEINMT